VDLCRSDYRRSHWHRCIVSLAVTGAAMTR
jgi:hypothetical protein